MKRFTPAVRRYIYTVLVAIGAVLVLYGLVSGDELAVWLNVAAVALMTGGVDLARRNTPHDDND